MFECSAQTGCLISALPGGCTDAHEPTSPQGRPFTTGTSSLRLVASALSLDDAKKVALFTLLSKEIYPKFPAPAAGEIYNFFMDLLFT